MRVLVDTITAHGSNDVHAIYLSFSVCMLDSGDLR